MTKKERKIFERIKWALSLDNSIVADMLRFDNMSLVTHQDLINVACGIVDAQMSLRTLLAKKQ